MYNFMNQLVKIAVSGKYMNLWFLYDVSPVPIDWFCHSRSRIIEVKFDAKTWT